MQPEPLRSEGSVSCLECKDDSGRGMSCPLTSAQFTGKAEEDHDPGIQAQPRMQPKDK